MTHSLRAATTTAGRHLPWKNVEQVKACDDACQAAISINDDHAMHGIFEESPKAMTGPCVVRLGWWGFAVDGCTSIAGPAVLRSMAYEQAGRYLDIGDFGGAIRALPPQ